MSENEDKSKLSRRQFFGLVWVIAGVALVAQAGKALMDFMTPVL